MVIRLSDQQHQQPKVDWFIFSLGAALLGAVVLPIVAFPEVSESAINVAFGAITQELGVIYVVLATTILVFLLYKIGRASCRERV